MFWQRWVGSQFRKPTGILGHWAAKKMAQRNFEHYLKVIELLQIEDQDRVLEIGCGAGLAISQITEKNAVCQVWGLDFSGLMLKKAMRNNRAAVQQNRVSLKFGEFTDFDFGSVTFSKIFCINVIYFWEDLGLCFRKMNRLLAPGGRFILYMSGPERLSQMPFAVAGVFNKYPVGEVVEALNQAGFARVEQQTELKKGHKIYYLSASK